VKKKPLRRISTKKQAENKVQRQDRYDMLALFMRIWKDRGHYCASCGTYLGKEARTYMFDHLLEKSKYPALMMDEDNIFLCCWECHSKKTNGHPTKPHQDAVLTYKQNIGL